MFIYSSTSFFFFFLHTFILPSKSFFSLCRVMTKYDRYMDFFCGDGVVSDFDSKHTDVWLEFMSGTSQHRYLIFQCVINNSNDNNNSLHWLLMLISTIRVINQAVISGFLSNIFRMIHPTYVNESDQKGFMGRLSPPDDRPPAHRPSSTCPTVISSNIRASGPDPWWSVFRNGARGAAAADLSRISTSWYCPKPPAVILLNN